MFVNGHILVGRGTTVLTPPPQKFSLASALLSFAFCLLILGVGAKGVLPWLYRHKRSEDGPLDGSACNRTSHSCSALSSFPQCLAFRIQLPLQQPPIEGRTCEAVAAPCITPSGPRRPRLRFRLMEGKWAA